MDFLGKTGKGLRDLIKRWEQIFDFFQKGPQIGLLELGKESIEIGRSWPVKLEGFCCFFW
jgi:hypothetical protein